MDSPIHDISAAIDACAASPNADSQVRAIHRYFLPNASFLHPLIYIAPSPSPDPSSPLANTPSSYSLRSPFPSLASIGFKLPTAPAFDDEDERRNVSARHSIHSICAAYRTYRTCIPDTRFEITSVAFDKQSRNHGKLFVDLYQFPYVRGVSWMTGWRPKLEMHVHFWLVRVGEDEIEGGDHAPDADGRGKWMIARQEDTIQPFAALLAVPMLIPLAWMLSIMCTLAAWIVMSVGAGTGLWSSPRTTRDSTVISPDQRRRHWKKEK